MFERCFIILYGIFWKHKNKDIKSIKTKIYTNVFHYLAVYIFHLNLKFKTVFSFDVLAGGWLVHFKIRKLNICILNIDVSNINLE